MVTNPDSTLWADTTIVKIIGDTLMPNDTTYYIFENADIIGGKYVYSDSSAVYYYDDSAAKSVKIFKLQAEIGEKNYFSPFLNYELSYITQIDSMNDIFGQTKKCLYFNLDGLVSQIAGLSADFGVQYFYSAGEPAGEEQSAATLLYCRLSGMEYGNPLLSIDKKDTGIKLFSLSQNYPNPFNPRTKFTVYIGKAGYLTSVLYDINGREVKTIFSGYVHACARSLTIDGRQLSSGVYFYSAEINGSLKYKKCILLK